MIITLRLNYRLKNKVFLPVHKYTDNFNKHDCGG